MTAMQIGVIGVNHKLADLQLREHLAKVCQIQFVRENLFRKESSFVLLSTCNRTEIYFGSEDMGEAHSYFLQNLRKEIPFPFEQKLYSYFGIDCFSHLVKVATGLDSAIPGETEIQGQVKQAYETSQKTMTLLPEIHFMFQKGLKIAKELRTKFEVGRGLPDIEHAVLTAGLNMFGDAWERSILVVGFSEINQRICRFLKHRGFKSITVVNRTDEKAARFAEENRFSFMPWEELYSWPLFDWVVVGTKSHEYLLHDKGRGKRESHQLLIDLSVPRNIDPDLGVHKEITLLNIDQMNHEVKYRERQIRDLLAVVEEQAAQEVHKYYRLFKERPAKERLLLEA